MKFLIKLGLFLIGTAYLASWIVKHLAAQAVQVAGL